MPNPSQSEPSQPNSLFRIEPAVAGRRRECDAFARSPATHSFLVYTTSALIVAAAIFVCTQQLARKSSVPGRIDLAESELKLYTDSRRILSELYVSDGELVKQGQPLALLTHLAHADTNTPSVTSQDSGYHSLLKSLNKEQQRLQDAKTDAQNESSLSRTNLQARVDNLSTTLKSLGSERGALVKLAAISEEALERGRELNKAGHVALTQLDELEQRHTLNLLKLDTNAREALAIEDRLQATNWELTNLPLQLKSRLGQLDEALGKTNRELTQLSMNLEVELRAPADGLITGVLSHSGATVDPDRPLITMVKNGSTFRAKLWASSQAAGDLQLDQGVNLLLDAFPHQKHGMLSGHITHINHSPLSLSELDAPWEGQGPTYALTIAIDTSSPLYHRLKPGMNLTADIKLDDSLVVERMFEPLIQAWQRTL